MPTISNLPAASAISDGNLLPVVQSNVTRKATMTQVLTYVEDNITFSADDLTGVVSLAHGGTNKALTASNGGIVYTDANSMEVLAGIANAGCILISGANSAPSWLATANNGVLVTDGSGIPSISSTLPTAVQDNITRLGAQSETLDMNSHLISNIADPVGLQDAATKNYVDQVAQGLKPKPSSEAATTANLNATYNNGSSGVGATLTNAGALAALVIDGYSVSLNDLILVKDQSAPEQNGLYTATTVGSGAVAWVLTRSIYMDKPSEFYGGYTYIINGTTNAGRAYIESDVVTTIGTDPVTFVQFSSSKSLTVVTSTFDASATYTPTVGMVNCVVEIVGGGGGGGGAAGTAGEGAAAGAGGGAGYCKKTYSAAEIGANAAIVIGAAGTGGAAGNNNGNNGGNSTFTPAGGGATLTANGGQGGSGTAASATAGTAPGGDGGTATGGDLNIAGMVGGDGWWVATTGTPSFAGGGGDSHWGYGGESQVITTNLNGAFGDPGYGHGAGASGGVVVNTVNVGGGDGSGGLCIITEYILS